MTGHGAVTRAVTHPSRPGAVTNPSSSHGPLTNSSHGAVTAVTHGSSHAAGGVYKTPPPVRPLTNTDTTKGKGKA